MSSDLVKTECDIDTMYKAWGLALMSTGAPWVLVVILIALNVLEHGSLMAAERHEFAKSPSGDIE